MLSLVEHTRVERHQNLGNLLDEYNDFLGADRKVKENG
jgi:hypothetical protein